MQRGIFRLSGLTPGIKFSSHVHMYARTPAACPRGEVLRYMCMIVQCRVLYVKLVHFAMSIIHVIVE